MLIKVLQALIPRNPRFVLPIWCVSLLLSACGLWAFLPLLMKGNQSYTDIVVGYVTWLDTYKTGDILLPYVVFLVFFCSYVALTLLGNLYDARRLNNRLQRNGAAQSTLPRRQIIGWLIGIAGFTTTFVIYRGGTLWPYWIVFVGALVLAFGCRYLHEKTLEKIHGILSGSIRGSIYGFFSPIALWVGYCVVTGESLPALQMDTTWVVAASTGVLLLITKSLGLSRTSQILLLLFQLPLPLFFLAYLGVTFSGTQGDSPIQANSYGRSVVFLWTGFCFLCIGLRLIAAVRGRPENQQSVTQRDPWTSMVALVAFFLFTPPPYSFLSGDDFHLGELLTPWQQVVHFGLEPYKEFVSVQGLIGLLYGGMNAFFFDDTLATFGMGCLWSALLIATVQTILCYRLLGNLTLLIIPVLLPASDRLQLIPITLLFLAQPEILKTSSRWLIAFVAASLVHIFWNATSCVAIGVGLTPLALFMAWRGHSDGEWQTYLKKPFLPAFGLLLVILLAIKVAPLLLGVLTYVRENGSTNTVAYGVPLNVALTVAQSVPVWFSTPEANWILWEVFRVGGWIVAALLLTLVFTRYLVALRPKLSLSAVPKESVPALMFIFCGITLAIVMVPYSLGRIDPAHLSRSGPISLLLLSFFVPAATFFMLRATGRLPLSTFILGMGLGVTYAFAPYQISTLSSKIVLHLAAPADAVRLDGAAVGFPQLGKGYVPPPRFEEIRAFKAEIDKQLAPAETYLDLTNRSAFYFFVNKPSPVPYEADYLAANSQIQDRTIARLQQTQPKLVWVTPAVRFDGPPTSLRAYRLYRWLLLSNYVPYETPLFLFLKKSAQRASDPSSIELLEKVFFLSNLQSVPRAWGRNFEKLSSRFMLTFEKTHAFSLKNFRVEKEWLTISDRRPTIEWDFPTPLKGSESDFLLVRLERRSSKDGKPLKKSVTAELSWSGSESPDLEHASFKFDVDSGEFLVPLGSQPSWLLHDSIRRLRLTIRQDDRGAAWKIFLQGFKLIN